MVAENENFEKPTEAARDAGVESSSQSSASISESQSADSTPESQSANNTESQPLSSAPAPAPPPLEDRLKKGAKGYLMKIGKLMVMFAILGSLLICFATYMISSTFSNIFNKLEHPLD